jgi:hypothetical protein
MINMQISTIRAVAGAAANNDALLLLHLLPLQRQCASTHIKVPA